MPFIACNGKYFVSKITLLQATLTRSSARFGRVVGALRQILTKRKALSKSKRETQEKTIKYFENHKDRMRYDKIFDGRLSHRIGSGGVRFAAEINPCRRGDWDAYWKAHMDAGQYGLYGDAVRPSDYTAHISEKN